MALSVLLSRSTQEPTHHHFQSLFEGGISAVTHALGSTPAMDFGSFQVAVIEVGEKVDAAVAQTKRWRAELGDDLLPIVWVLSRASALLTARGLDAGADVVLSDPLEAGVLLAQVRAASRLRAIGQRLAARANEARLLGDQLQRAYRQIDYDQDAARKIQQAFIPKTLPTLGSARFAVSHRPRNRAGGDFFDVRLLDENRVGFFLGDVVGGGRAGSLTGFFAAQSVAFKHFEGDGYRILEPGEILTHVNLQLLGLGIEDRPLVAMLVAILNAATGEVLLARAGIPAPVLVPSRSEPLRLSIPGPFLGTADASYPTIKTTLRPGDRLVLASDGIRPQGDPGPGNDEELKEAVTRHRGLSGQGFTDAIANDLMTQVRHSDDFTLLCVGMSDNSVGA